MSTTITLEHDTSNAMFLTTLFGDPIVGIDPDSNAVWVRESNDHGSTDLVCHGCIPIRKASLGYRPTPVNTYREFGPVPPGTMMQSCLFPHHTITNAETHGETIMWATRMFHVAWPNEHQMNDAYADMVATLTASWAAHDTRYIGLRFIISALHRESYDSALMNQWRHITSTHYREQLR